MALAEPTTSGKSTSARLRQLGSANAVPNNTINIEAVKPMIYEVSSALQAPSDVILLPSKIKRLGNICFTKRLAQSAASLGRFIY